MITLMKRSLKLFFRDRMNMFFSLLGVVIIIVLYMLFLGDVMRQSLPDMEGVRFMMDSWIMAGTLAVSTLTTTMGALGYAVYDRVNKIDRDFRVSPMPRRKIAGGYFLGALGIGGIQCLVTLLFAEGYILLYGGKILPLPGMLKLLGVLALSLLSSGGLAFFAVSFFRSANAYGTASMLVGSMTGFLAGIYMPIGNLPGTVQWVVRLFPVAHSAALIRQIMMEAPMAVTFRGAPAEVVAAFNEELGVAFSFGGHVLPAWGGLLVLAGTAAVFFTLGFWNLTRKRK